MPYYIKTNYYTLTHSVLRIKLTPSWPRCKIWARPLQLNKHEIMKAYSNINQQHTIFKMCCCSHLCHSTFFIWLPTMHIKIKTFDLLKVNNPKNWTPYETFRLRDSLIGWMIIGSKVAWSSLTHPANTA